MVGRPNKWFKPLASLVLDRVQRPLNKTLGFEVQATRVIWRNCEDFNSAIYHFASEWLRE